MQKKKQRWAIAKWFRKQGLGFNESQKLSRAYVQGTIDGLNKALNMGFRLEPKMAVTCSRGCCREQVGTFLIGYNIQLDTCEIKAKVESIRNTKAQKIRAII